MASNVPHLVLLAGPNGAGKSTAAPRLLKGALAVVEFVNADTIARGLSAFAPEETALLAGRIMLERARVLSRRRVSFAFETTLASRSLAPWIRTLLERNEYKFHLLFIWLPDAETAVARVRARVVAGGHDVPAEIVRRRYERGLKNFFQLYKPLATTWRFYDNSCAEGPRAIATGRAGSPPRVYDRVTWERIKEAIGHAY